MTMAMALAHEFDPEAPVIEAIRERDRCAFAEFVRRQNDWVRGVIFGVLGRSDALDDVAQQVWTAVWQRIGELRDTQSWRPWLYRLARNAAVDAGREASRQRAQRKAAARQIPWAADPAETTAISAERTREMLAAIGGLPPLYREPFVLRHMNGWNYQQIAEAMGMPVDSIETRLVRARRLLRDALKHKAGF
jgi:RNA polymerase sigma-70 factor (ECF subfamily)